MSLQHTHFIALPLAAWKNLRSKPAQLFVGAFVWAAIALLVRWVLSGLLEQLDNIPTPPPPFLLWQIAGMYLVMVCAWLVMCTFYLILVACDPHSFYKNARHTVKLVGPMASVLFIVALRSFFWLACLGFVLFQISEKFQGIGLIVFCAGVVLCVMRLPRFFLVPFLLVRGHPPLRAIAMSLERTFGHWKKIAGTVLVIAFGLLAMIIVFGAVLYQLISIPLLFVHSSVASFISLLSLSIFALLLQYAWQLLQVFGLACCIELADALQRQKKPKKQAAQRRAYPADDAASTIPANSVASRDEAPTNPPSTSGSEKMS